MSMRDVPISFPGLFGDWRFTVSGKLLDIGNGVYWYGVLIAAGLLLAIWLCSHLAPQYGFTGDDVLDVVLWAVPLGVIGARLYYILFYLDLYRDESGALDFVKMVRIWDGGLAIYGGIILGFLTAALCCRRKKIPAPAFLDCVVMGVLVGQIVGRWGNFMNREAYGAATDLPWRMRLWLSETNYLDVHPTFLYESLWNLLGLALLVFVVSKHRRFDGQNLLFYFLWYGTGRFFIEGLRTDSLYLFNWTAFGHPIRVSQALSLLLALSAAIALWYFLCVKRKTPDGLYVNRSTRIPQPSPAADGSPQQS